MSDFDPQSFLKTLTTRPGVYQMFDEQGVIIYVGKAKNLKNRVSSYFRKDQADSKTKILVSKIADIKITITQSENEALLLESNLIKKHRPRYNVLLRDDKSYPYLILSAHDSYPRLDIHRGAKRKKGQYFGPYPNSRSVYETLALLQKLFKLRQCSESFFSNRSRPCLQYQIKRCTAPCVKFISPEDYQKDVEHATLFLKGKCRNIINEIAGRMNVASEEMRYEDAARLRDQIAKLRDIQQQQYVTTEEGNVDVIAIVQGMESVCIQIIFIRGGRLIGNRAFFPNKPAIYEVTDVLAAFLPQYYLNSLRGEELPKKVLLNIQLPEQEWIQSALSEQLEQKIQLVSQVRGKNRQWLKMALTNAEHALASHNSLKKGFYARLEALQKALNFENMPQRIECFDISHTMGEATVGSCVVYTIDGPKTSDYRRFNIKDITPGDDYAAMQQVLSRRYTSLKKNDKILPDVIMIDGGKGQMHVAEKVLEDLQVSGVTLLSITKGPGRKPEYDRIFISGRAAHVDLKADSMALHLLQHIRDEAHRFAISAHRKQRAKKRITSELNDIPGIGPKKRRDLLSQFGGLQELKRASVEEIAKVPGISPTLSQAIYDHLHPG